MLDTMKAWLMTFPKWEGSLQLDYTDTGSCGLYPRGLTELSRREDVLGNVTVRWAWNFILRRNAGRREENARWLMDFQTWVMEQGRLGLTPQFGDDPKNERLRAFDGALHTQSQPGSSLYTVSITAEFTKYLKGE